MADSDNNMSLPFVTIMPVTKTGTAATGSRPATLTLDADPALAAWHDWQDAHNLTERLCREQQQLERTLVETVGVPFAMIPQSSGECITVYSFAELRETPCIGSLDTEVRAKAEADLAGHKTRWEAADRQIGYSLTQRAEHEAADQAKYLLQALSETPAATLAGVAAKLDAVLKEGQPSTDDAEFP